jgi:hypothetical protein
MSTARDFVTLALKEAGVLGIGQTALPEDINDGFTLLTRMLAQWQKKRWLVPNLIDVSANGNNLISNPIGPGQYYNSARPDKIQAAYFKQLNAGNTVANQVSYPLTPIWSYEDYARIQLKNLNTWPQYFFYDGAFPYGNVFIWPIPSSAYEIHLIVKGPIGFNIELLSGVITAAGAAYTNGAYLAIPFTNVSSLGGGGTADVTVAGGIVTAIAIHDPGDGYKINDVLSLDNTLMGGTGAGVLWKVTDVTSDLDATFNMPPEYEEAIHYNLCVRLVSMYQYPANPVQGKLAKVALQTLKNSNLQVPTLQMPRSLRFHNGNGGFYIFNADQF